MCVIWNGSLRALFPSAVPGSRSLSERAHPREIDALGTASAPATGCSSSHQAAHLGCSNRNAGRRGVATASCPGRGIAGRGIPRNLRHRVPPDAATTKPSSRISRCSPRQFRRKLHIRPCNRVQPSRLPYIPANLYRAAERRRNPTVLRRFAPRKRGCRRVLRSARLRISPRRQFRRRDGTTKLLWNWRAKRKRRKTGAVGQIAVGIAPPSQPDRHRSRHPFGRHGDRRAGNVSPGRDELSIRTGDFP